MTSIIDIIDNFFPIITQYGPNSFLSYIPNKFFLYQSLRLPSFPFWSFTSQLGEPIFAQGKLAVFSIFNIYYLFLPFTMAFNLTVFSAFAVAFSGVYFLAKYLKLSTLASLYSALLFSFSAWMTTHLSQPNLLYASAWLPYIFLAFLKISSGKLKYLPLFIFVLSQQFFTTCFQIAFISFLIIILYLLFSKTLLKKDIKQSLFLLLLGLILALAASIIQLGPTLEYFTNSSAMMGQLFSQATQDPFTFKNLATLIFPFRFGSPASGTYPLPTNSWGSFTENSLYMGWLTIIIILGGFYFIKDKNKYFFLGLFLVSIILALGKFSPLQFIYAFPPFNFFSFPSRYLLMTTFAISLLAGLSLQSIKNKVPKIFAFLLASIPLLTFLQLAGYNKEIIIFFDRNDLFTIPWVADNETKRYLSLGKIMEEDMLKKTAASATLQKNYKNALALDTNLLFGINNLTTQNDFAFKNIYIFKGLIDHSIEKDIKNQTIGFNSLTFNLLSLAGVQKIITPLEIKNNPLGDSFEQIPDSFGHYKLYNNPEPLPQFYLACKSEKFTDIKEFWDFIARAGLNKMILSKDLDWDNCSDWEAGEIIIIETKTNSLDLQVSSRQETLLVFSDLNYPGWSVVINSKRAKIYEANYFQKAVVVPAGESIVSFSFLPTNFKSYLLISAFTHLAIGLAWCFWTPFLQSKFSHNILFFPGLYSKFRRLPKA